MVVVTTQLFYFSFSLSDIYVYNFTKHLEILNLVNGLCKIDRLAFINMGAKNKSIRAQQRTIAARKQQITKTHPPNILVFVIIDLVLFNVQRLQERLSRQDVDLAILYFSIFVKRGPKPKLKLKRA